MSITDGLVLDEDFPILGKGTSKYHFKLISNGFIATVETEYLGQLIIKSIYSHDYIDVDYEAKKNGIVNTFQEKWTR